jgi:Family of unknown function (DUF5372)
VVVTHPFHPLRGQRLAVLFERDYPDGLRLFVCEGGLRGSIGIWEDSTDRAPAPASDPLTADVLAGLVELVGLIDGAGRIGEPVRETRTGS